MNFLKLQYPYPYFIRRSFFFIDEESNIYLDAFAIRKYEDNPHTLIKFDKHFEQKKTISYNAMMDGLANDIFTPHIHNLFISKDGEYVFTLTNNSVFVIDENGTVLNQYPKNLSENVNEQTPDMYFAAKFVYCKDGKVLVLTYGNNGAHCLPNQRGRFILGLSKDVMPSFKDNLPFPTIYLNDISTDEVFYSVPNMNMHNKQAENISKEMLSYQNFKHEIFQKYFISNNNEYLRIVNNHKLGNSTRHRLTELYGWTCIKDIIDLNETQLLISMFTDGQSKATHPDKNTAYYLLILDKTTGSIIGDISPNDTSIYKNPPYKICEDQKYNRIVFKTFENIYFINRHGVVYERISLAERDFSLIRSWSLLGISRGVSFFYDSKTEALYSFEMGEAYEDIAFNTLNALKEVKKIRSEFL